MLKSLGVWARVALASRCAERVLPLYTLPAELDPAQEDAVVEAVALSRDVAVHGGGSRPGESATAAAVRVAVAARALGTASRAAADAARDAGAALGVASRAAREALRRDAAARTATRAAAQRASEARAAGRAPREDGVQGGEGDPEATWLAARAASRLATRAAGSAERDARAADVRAEDAERDAIEVAVRGAEAARLAAVRAADAAKASAFLSHAASATAGGAVDAIEVLEAANAAVVAANEAALSAIWAVVHAIGDADLETIEDGMPGATLDAALRDANWLRLHAPGDSLVPPAFFQRPLWPVMDQDAPASWKVVIDTCHALVMRAQLASVDVDTEV